MTRKEFVPVLIDVKGNPIYEELDISNDSNFISEKNINEELWKLYKSNENNTVVKAVCLLFFKLDCLSQKLEKNQ